MNGMNAVRGLTECGSRQETRSAGRGCPEGVGTVCGGARRREFQMTSGWKIFLECVLRKEGVRHRTEGGRSVVGTQR